MNKKIIMIAGFWLCLLAPNLLYPFMKNESDTGTDENRALADFPHLSLQTLESYPGEMDSYINDHAAFRNRFLSLNARLNLDLFDYPDSTEVLKGKDGWYFYTAGSSLADCLGINRYPEPVLQAITRRLPTTSNLRAFSLSLFSLPARSRFTGNISRTAAGSLPPLPGRRN